MMHWFDIEMSEKESITIFVEKICWIHQLANNTVEIQFVNESITLSNITKDEIITKIGRITANG